ncbi:hypothetical protein AB0N24_03040 [Arthrobacter sp. NPDC093128]|uniref:hypothetical protein n=1 Tax=Arthrobacter sp. NPDC093128 TaxID=3154979 RepID=UPI00341BD049
MKRWLAPIAVIAALAAGTGPAVAASAKPGPVGTDPFYVNCADFQLKAQLSGKAGTIVLPGGRFTFTGPNLRITFTNEKTGETASYVITGATHVTVLDDGTQLVTATGLNTILVPEANGHPAGVYFTRGTMNWVLDKNNQEVGDKFTGSGKVTDVCALLA